MNTNSFSRMVMVGFFVTMMFVSQTGASELFVAKTGRGPNCTQAKPCSLPKALTQATDGDTVYVAGGRYTGTGSAVITVTKSITLRGGWNGSLRRPPVCNPERHVTTLDGEDARQVVSISSGISSTIEGFVITRGNSESIGGGGIGTESSSTIIRNNLIIANTTSEAGGAILINRGSAQILGNKIL